MSDLWTTPVTADGGIATPEQMLAAWHETTVLNGRLRSFQSSELSLALVRNGVIARGKNGWFSAYRIADQMCQKARKAGVIRYAKGRWHLVPEREEG